MIPSFLSDRCLFFGRDKEVQDVVSLLLTTRLVILQGASGVGKTSLLRAGLLPRLPSTHYTVVMVETTDRDPIEGIKAALRHARGDNELFQDQSLADCLAATLAARRQPVVVILDNFEEFFRHFRRAEERHALRQALGQCLAETQLDVHFLLALQEEYFGRLAEFQHSIRGVYETTMRLERLTLEQATAAVVEPAQQLGLEVDMALLTSVILPQLLDADGHIEPPLLQIVCHTLYQHAQQTGETTLGEAAYAAMGDVRTVLERYLESVLQQFGPDQQQARGVLTALVTSEGTRWIAGIDELIQRVPPAGGPLEAELLELLFLRRLVQARLVRVHEVEGHTRYALIHDFLVPHIEVWVEDHERERRHILETIHWYYNEFQKYYTLMPEETLEQIAPWELEVATSLPAAQRELIATSKRAVRHKRRRRLRQSMVLILMAITIASSLWGWKWYQASRQLEITNQQLAEQKETAETQRQHAEQAARAAEAQTRRADLHLAQALLEQASRAMIENRPLHSYVLSAQALVLDPASARARALAYTSSVDMPYVFQGVVSHRAHSLQRIALSPDGHTLAAAAADGTIQLWALPSRQPLLFLTPPETQGTSRPVSAANSPDYRLAFSPDSHTLVAAGDGVIRLWALPSGQLQATFTDDQAQSTSVAFWPDGQTLAVASTDRERGDVTLRLWALPIGWPLHNFTFAAEPSFDSIALSPDGHTLAAWQTRASYPILRVLEVPSGRLLATLTLPHGPLTSVAFSPDGHTLVTAGDLIVLWRWEVPSGQPLMTVPSLGGPSTSVTFGSVGKVWEVPNRDGPSTSVAFSPDGHTLATSGQYVRLWALPTGAPPIFYLDPRGAPFSTTLLDHQEVVQGITFSADGHTLAYGTEDGTIQLWTANAQSRSTITTLKGQSDAVFSPDGRTFATCGWGGVEIWALPRGQHVATLNGPLWGGWIQEVASDAWGQTIQKVAFSPAGHTLAVLGKLVGALWTLPSGQHMAPLDGFPWGGEIQKVAFSPDGRTLVAVFRGTVVRGTGAVWLWAVPSGQLLATFGWRDDVDARAQIEISPDGHTLAVDARDGTIQLWDVPSGQLRTLLPSRTDPVSRIAFSPDGSLLAVAFAEGKETAIALWKLPTGQLPSVLPPPAFLSDEDGEGIDGIVDQLTFSPEGSLLAAGTAADGMLHLWAVPTFRYLTRFGVGEMGRLTFLPDGHTLAVGQTNGFLQLWPQLELLHMTPEALYEQAQRATGMRVEGSRVQVIDTATQEAGEPSTEEPAQQHP